MTNKPDVPVEPEDPEVTNADDSGAEKPNLNGLVPIKWNGTTWIKADENNGSGENQWYDYNQQMWANAASVTEEYRNKNVGEEIPESAINAYFVWVPRYEYDYVNIENYAGGSAAQPGQININFIATSKTSPSSNYKIHPAFTFGNQELSGIWVGKFETSADSSSACFTSPSKDNCNNASQSPYIKPNAKPLIYMSVSNMFTTAQKFSTSGNSYGISTSADAHMMKNSEWGAVAYLSQSKYGKYGNSSYSGANKEVYINNIQFTGCNANFPFQEGGSYCIAPYNKAGDSSTTGTIYGVYDMSGGYHEYVMGYYTNASSEWGATSENNVSGFSSTLAAKYYDAYGTENVTTACSSGICYGHALSETSGWYSDAANFVHSRYPWFQRGGYSHSTTSAGVFAFSRYNGGADNTTTFRVVMLGE